MFSTKTRWTGHATATLLHYVRMGNAFMMEICRSMVVYNLKCKLHDIDFVGKTQCHFKKRTSPHTRDEWKVIKSSRRNFRPHWSGSGGYTQADTFAIHFAQHCKVATNSNDTCRKFKQIMEHSILWQGIEFDAWSLPYTMQCKICMVENKEILHRLKTDKSKIMNYNSDIFSSCKCCSRIPKFCRVTNPTLTMRMMQKIVPSTRHSKQKRRRSLLITWILPKLQSLHRAMTKV